MPLRQWLSHSKCRTANIYFIACASCPCISHTQRNLAHCGKTVHRKHGASARQTPDWVFTTSAQVAASGWPLGGCSSANHDHRQHETIQHDHSMHSSLRICHTLSVARKQPHQGFCSSTTSCPRRTCYTGIRIRGECCEPGLWEEKAGTAITTERGTIKWVCVARMRGVRVAWAAYTACLAAVFGQWLALCFGNLLTAAVVPLLTTTRCLSRT